MSDDVINCDCCSLPCYEKVVYAYDDKGGVWCDQNMSVREKLMEAKRLLTKGNDDMDDRTFNRGMALLNQIDTVLVERLGY